MLKKRAAPASIEQSVAKKLLFPVVGVGASAGGLEAFTAFLKHLPANSGMAFVLIQHLDPKQHSGLTDLLSKATKMPVLEVNADIPVEPDHVYVIAPGVRLSMSDGHLRVEQRGSGRNLPIDYFLQSLAHDNTSKAIGIVLSGTASDGTLGLGAVKAEGGITFAQEPSSAKFDGMPRSAIAAGVVDFVLAPEEIAKRLVRLAQHPHLAVNPEEDGDAAQETESALNRIFQILRTVTGNDFTYYKHTTIRRRIHRRMVLHANEKLDDYVAYLQQNPAEVKALADDLLIRVTAFFREPNYFEALSDKVFPEILKNRSPDDAVRIWVPGCATGEEAYSIAIGLTEFLEQAGISVLIQIFASDISESAIVKAQTGIYPLSVLADVSPARLKRFFVKTGAGYQIAKSIRDTCIFSRHNVTKDPPFNKLDLITCCNVLIYFGPVLQRKTLSMFDYALKPGGFLLLGPSEGIGPLAHSFQQLDKKLKLYSKQPGSKPLKLPFLPDEGLAVKVTGAMPGGDTRAALDVQKSAERMLLAQYAPAGVIVDEAMNIVHVRGETGPYLQLASGEPTYNLLKLAREDLVVGLRAAIVKARHKKAAVSQHVSMKHNGRLTDITLRVIPVNGSANPALHLMVLFEEAAPAPAPDPAKDTEQREAADDAGAAKTIGAHNAREKARLRQELAATREYLQSIIEDQEASTEELKSVNEEAQASNEELETAKEELQSANEELNTVNDELKTRNVVLTEVNTDLSNVLTSINVPLVIVGKDLKIRHFTRSMEPVLNLIESDIGRSISDLKPNIDVPDLPELLRKVVNGGSSVEREVLGPKGRWYALQALPYQAPDNKIDGALLVMLDIDAARNSRNFAEAIVETVRHPLVVLSKDFKIRSANKAFYETFQTSKGETENISIYDLGNGQWNIPRLREALEKILPAKSQFADFEVDHQFEGIGRKTMLLSAREIQQPTPFDGATILLAIEDITGRIHAEKAQAQLAAIVTSSNDAILSKTLEGIITTWNAGAERLFLYTAGEMAGQSILRLIPPELHGEEELIMGRVKAGEHIEHFETVRLRKDGHRIPVSLTISPIRNSAGKIIGVSRIARDITVRRQAEKALRDSEERYRALFSASSQVVYRMNADWSQMLHLEGREFLADTTDPSQTWLDKYIHPDDQLLVTGVINEAIRSKSIFELEHRVRRADDTFGWALSRAIPLLNETGDIMEWFGAASDVTQRKEAEEGLRQSEARFRFMAESMPQKMFTATAGGAVDYFNQQWFGFTGLSFGQIRDWGWTGFIHPEDVEENVRRWKHSIETGEPFQFTHRFRRADGVYRWHLSRAHAMRDGEGKISLWIGSNTDIHEEKETEQELRRANANLNQFAFAASHDLQEPLRMITAYSQLLLKNCRAEMGADAEVFVGYVTDGTRRMRALLADLLSYSAAAAELPEPTGMVNLNQVFATVMQDLQPAIVESGASVTGDELPSVSGHGTHFVQLLQNLIGNALKYRALELPRIHVAVAKMHDEWRFSVADNGIGIAPEYHQTIFGVFKRLQGKEIPGTGIGLAICQRVAERYGGRIWVESELGKGATFYFTLPSHEKV